MTQRTTIGLVGCGGWGKNILRDLIMIGCDVHVVATSESGRKNASAVGATSVVGSIGVLPALDGAVCAVPTQSHAIVIEELLQRFPSIPIYTEKPLTNSLGDAERLAASAGDRLFVMDKWRYHPGILELARIAKSGELSTVQGLSCIRQGWGNGRSAVDAIWHLVPHDLTIALEVLGFLPKARVAVSDGSNEGVAYGMIALLGDDPWLSLEVSTRAPKNLRVFKLYCQNGVATLNDSYADHVEVVRHEPGRLPDKPTIERRPVSTKLPLLAELEAFVAHVRGGPPPKSSAAEGVAVVRALTDLQCLTRAASKQAVAAGV